MARIATWLRLGGVAPGAEEARRRVEAAIADGSGLATLRRIVEAQGGDARALDDPDRLPRPAGTLEVRSRAAGLVEAIDAEALGLCAMALGAGRARVEDRIDPAVGLTLRRKVGDRVERDEPLCAVHHGRLGAEPPERVAERVLAAFRVGPGPASAGPLFLERID